MAQQQMWLRAAAEPSMNLLLQRGGQ